MAVTKQAISTLEAAVRRLERAAKLLENEGYHNASLEIKTHAESIDVAIKHVKAKKVEKNNGA